MLKRYFVTACDAVFAARPLILLPAWGLYLLGSAAAGPIAVQRAPAPFALLSLTAVLAMAYLLNQIFDRESDERNAKCFYLARGIFTVRSYVLMAAILFAAGSWGYHRTADGLHALLLTALGLSLVYSLPPFRLCARPIVDMLANAVGYGGVAWILGFVANGGDAVRGAVGCLPFVGLVAATFIHTAILDARGDAATGKRSTAVSLGSTNSRRLALLIQSVSFAAAFTTGDPTTIIVIALATLASIYAWRQPGESTSAFVAQWNTVVVTVAAIFHWPPYGLVVIPLVWLSRVYYYKRFGIRYPGPRRSV